MQSYRESFFEETAFYKPSQKQITALLLKIQGKSHEVKDYRELLLQKEEFQKQSEILSGGFEKLNRILDPKESRATYPQNVSDENYEVGGVCSICYEEIRGRGLKCHICNGVFCRNCIARSRSMKNGELKRFCQICDKQYLEAVMNKEFLKEFTLYQKALQTLIREQETMDQLLVTERKRINSKHLSEERQIVLKNDEFIQQLKKQKQDNKEKLHEIKNKISWGESITKGLRVKHRKLKKLLQQSFGSSNSESAYLQWEPPKAEDEIDLEDDYLNKSLITSNFEQAPKNEQVEGTIDRENCKCQLI